MLRGTEKGVCVWVLYVVTTHTHSEEKKRGDFTQRRSFESLRERERERERESAQKGRIRSSNNNFWGESSAFIRRVRNEIPPIHYSARASSPTAAATAAAKWKWRYCYCTRLFPSGPFFFQRREREGPLREGLLLKNNPLGIRRRKG